LSISQGGSPLRNFCTDLRILRGSCGNEIGAELLHIFCCEYVADCNRKVAFPKLPDNVIVHHFIKLYFVITLSRLIQSYYTKVSVSLPVDLASRMPRKRRRGRHRRHLCRPGRCSSRHIAHRRRHESTSPGHSEVDSTYSNRR
jgi:hypothetical protein